MQIVHSGAQCAEKLRPFKRRAGCLKFLRNFRAAAARPTAASAAKDGTPARCNRRGQLSAAWRRLPEAGRRSQTVLAAQGAGGPRKNCSSKSIRFKEV